MLASTSQEPVLLVGVAHVVDVEAPLRKALEGRTLDGVALELDDARAAQILHEGPAPPSGGSGPFFLRLWARLQQRLGDEMGAGAGGEMRAAARIAKERSLPLFLIDDPIRDTLRRLIASMSVKERVGLLVGAVVGVFLPTSVVKDQLDQYSEQPTDYLDAVREAYPSVARVLIDERNEHMADRLGALRNRGFGHVVAIVGDAHVPGLTEALKRRGIPVESIRFSGLRPPPPTTS